MLHTDGATLPDQEPQVSRRAGIGILITNTNQEQALTVYIQATMQNVLSVLMAETAALSLAAVVSNRMKLQQVNFLSDNQQIVSFLNMANRSTPPHWNIKFLTQEFLNSVPNQPIRVFKISRDKVSVAHTLATQAFHNEGDPVTNSTQCINIKHQHIALL